MTLVRGEDYAVGVAMETTPNTFVAATDYVRMREPATIQPVVEKVDIKETRATGVSSKGQEITMTKVEGEIPLNLRFRSIGYFLKSLLGTLTSATEAGETIVYRHSLLLNTAVVQPSLSLSMARGSFTHKKVTGAVVSKMSLSFPVDDVINGNVTIKAQGEATNSNFTAAYASTDHLAPHQTVTLKIAADVAGLSSATAIDVTDMKIELDRGTREKLSISSATPIGMVAKLLSISGSFTMDKDDDTYRDLALANTVKALQIQVKNTAQTIGVAAKPELTIVLPNVTFTTSEKRPLDDTITEEVSFVANYDDTAAKAISMSLVNEKTSY
ncbi:phage tail tube protein [Novosphingobium aquae]|uniref:Phage tail tube protein n=1 Tax=Novosphingobium aquae TaxID=3133435 RepID=A0ABU8SBV5_9SPHN